MKKNTVSFLFAAAAMVLMAGCTGGTNNSSSAPESGAVERDFENYEAADTDMTETEAQSAEPDGGTAVFDWLPAGVEQEKSETEPNEELRQLIVEYFEIPDYELADSRYYYNYVDLESDGTNEIFAVVVGSYTSGTGGSSALWCGEEDGTLVVKQELTLVNMPVIVADSEDGGAKRLILERSGGAAETEYVELTCTDGVYTNVSEAEAVDALDNVQGVAILCNDLADDMQTGNYLTLE